MKFYGELFSWKFHSWGGGPMEYWIVNTGDDAERGIHGGLMRRAHPDQPCVNTVDVPDLDAALEKVQALGGQIALAKMPVPGVGWLAYAKDLDGHIFGMMQNDPNAA
jgi:predicted enzyme related to lactoylglutathione lyase